MIIDLRRGNNRALASVLDRSIFPNIHSLGVEYGAEAAPCCSKKLRIQWPGNCDHSKVYHNDLSNLVHQLRLLVKKMFGFYFPTQKRYGSTLHFLEVNGPFCAAVVERKPALINSPTAFPPRAVNNQSRMELHYGDRGTQNGSWHPSRLLIFKIPSPLSRGLFFAKLI